MNTYILKFNECINHMKPKGQLSAENHILSIREEIFEVKIQILVSKDKGNVHVAKF